MTCYCYYKNNKENDCHYELDDPEAAALLAALLVLASLEDTVSSLLAAIHRCSSGIGVKCTPTSILSREQCVLQCMGEGEANVGDDGMAVGPMGVGSDRG